MTDSELKQLAEMCARAVHNEHESCGGADCELVTDATATILLLLIRHITVENEPRACTGNENGNHTCGLPIGGCGKGDGTMTDQRLRTVAVELLRLYDWRRELGVDEQSVQFLLATEQQPSPEALAAEVQLKRDLLKYGREKKAAWEQLRELLAAQPVASTDPHRCVANVNGCCEYCGEPVASPSVTFTIPAPVEATGDEKVCGAEFINSEIEYAPVPHPDGGDTFCCLPKGHGGAHIDDSMAGRIAWMTRAEVEASEIAAPSAEPLCARCGEEESSLLHDYGNGLTIVEFGNGTANDESHAFAPSEPRDGRNDRAADAERDAKEKERT